ncbi:MAG: F0F1 ATP synthase subunit epsilon [Ignavibacteriales bacterium]|nr:MAG: F0F1 ATP synthase subunit epsilon [Ignavibacteriales bacterium]
MASLNLEIITPSKSVFTGEIKSITIPGTSGSFQVLANHAPLISTFEIGEIKIEDVQSRKLSYSTAGGTVEISNNKVLVLADSLELVDNIDIQRALNSKERAENRLANKSVENIDVARAEASLARAINRIKLSEKYSAVK